MYQYFEDAMDPENRSLKEKTIFPSQRVFKGRRWDGWDQNSRERTINNCEDRLVVSHTDADGFVSAALLLDYFDNISVVNIDYENIQSTLQHINKHTGHIDEIYVTDLNLDEVYPVIDDIENNVDSFVWLDHHEWGEKEDALRNMGVDITIDNEKCAASIVLKYVQNKGYQPTESTLEAVQLTEDHDLWKHNMEKINFAGEQTCVSKVFSELAFYADDEIFMEKILDYGRDFLDYEEELLGDRNSEGFIEERSEESQRKVEYVLENHSSIKEIGEYKVGFVYGRASPGELLERLKEEEEIQILVHAKPTYPVKASFRSTDDFKKCHILAEKLGGGGHEQAAGCKPEMKQNPLEFIDYLQKRGQPLLRKAEDVIKEELE